MKENSVPKNTFLIIQTAFIGDVVLVTAMIEKLHQHYPLAKIDILVKKDHGQLFDFHPFINKVWEWDKSKNKTANLIKLIKDIRSCQFDYIINCQRFFSTGLLTVFSKAKYKIGFDKNPWSFFYDKIIEHIQIGLHETERNQSLISFLTDEVASKPRIYPNNTPDIPFEGRYITISPATVWFTKQYPKGKWIEFIEKIPEDISIVFLGGNKDREIADGILLGCKRHNLYSLCGKLSFLQSAGVMKHAILNYTNDSAPMHLCSAVNAPVAAIYCSTVPSFGFGPLSDVSWTIETKEELECRPCGLHGRKSCPKSHFRCAKEILVDQLIEPLHLLLA